MTFLAVAAFLTACGTSFVLSALICRIAPRLGLTDPPDGHRKLHAGPTPTGGGIALFLSTAGVVGLLAVLPDPWSLRLAGERFDLGLLLLAGGVLVVVGLLDDRMGLRGRHKLLGQILAASILIVGGLLVEQVEVFGRQVQLGVFAIPLTLIWLVGAINAVNLLDGIDGLATTVGVILSSAICAMAAIKGLYPVAIVALVFTGSLLGFLRFNFPPASMFLGDAGSMLIGLVVGMLAVGSSLKGPGTVLLAAPLAVWTIPIFDSAAAVLRRKLTGRSIYATDRSHLHHRLLDRLGSSHKVLGVIAACCALTSAAALLSVFMQSDLYALATCIAVVLIFCITGVFGRVELLLLTSRLHKAGLTWMQPIVAQRHKPHQAVIRLQGSRQWDLLWTALVESADKFNLTQIDLDVNLPAAREGYNATWKRPAQPADGDCWRIEIPLVTADHPIGRLKIAGRSNGQSACENVERLLDLLEPFETQLQQLMVEGHAPGTPATLYADPVERVLLAGEDAPTGMGETGAASSVPGVLRRGKP